jgi:hypothetical protein
MRFLLLAALTLALMTEAKAEYTAIGVGTSSCGSWTAYRRNREAFGFEQWILGFLSGAGFEGTDGTDPLNNTDADAVWAWMDNYCLAHPLDKIMNAGATFVTVH